jgi:hypothetical protein
MPTRTIFYSWQSDLPIATNRGFIQEALERAAKDIRSDEEIGIDPSIDRDTQGVPGSPNIVATIFEKIGRADVFVADVSFITPPDHARKRERKRIPNPNVLIELGYAAHNHGWGRILCVFNTAFGRVEDLPFDIRQHSITCYSLAKRQAKADVRRVLVAHLRNKIRLILTTPDAAAVQARTEFHAELARLLIDILINGEVYTGRLGPQPVQYDQADFKSAAAGLRRLAANQVAHDLGWEGELTVLADELGDMAEGSIHGGLFGGVLTRLTQAKAMAQALKAKCPHFGPLSGESIKDVCRSLMRTQRELSALSNRAGAMVFGRQRVLKESARELGRRLLRMGHYNLDEIGPDLADRLREIGRKLNVAESLRDYPGGGRCDELLEAIRDGAAA